jgi:hypothetical protein
LTPLGYALLGCNFALQDKTYLHSASLHWSGLNFAGVSYVVI